MTKKSGFLILLLAGGAFAKLASAGTSAQAQPPQMISDETVPVALTPNHVHCYDAVPDHGFGAVPATLLIEEKDLFDRTLRLAGVGGIETGLPEAVTCASLSQSLKNIPEGLLAHRLLERVTTQSLNNKRGISQLRATITLELPVPIGSGNAVLQGEQTWLEQNIPAGQLPGATLPYSGAYVVLAHPQASSDYGLTCQPDFPGSTTQRLTMSGFDGQNIDPGHSNVRVLGRAFADSASCEALRAALFERYRAEDPGNWGTYFKVNRTLESVYRYILDNQAVATCQEIQLDTATSDVNGNLFRGVKSFVVRTVELGLCVPGN